MSRWVAVAVACLAAAALVPAAAVRQDRGAAIRHPLDPLTEEEIRTATRALTDAGYLTGARRVAELALLEPAKELVLASRNPGDVPRRAFAVVHDRSSGATFEATVDLVAALVPGWTERHGVQPALYLDDFVETDRLLRADARWRAALARRGVDDPAQVQIEAAPAGFDGRAMHPQRLVRALSFVRQSSANPYARPLDGLVATIDLTAKAVTDVIDEGGPPPAAPEHDFMAGAVRPAARDGEHVASRSSVRDGHEVQWGPWRFRYAVHPREGLVLSLVTYVDGGRARPVLHRASLAEVLVIYADPASGWSFRSVFDEGEYGLGNSMVTLEPGGDVPAGAELVDAVLADSAGRPRRLARVIGLYERDGGLEWRHTDYLTGRTRTSRKRQLVVASVVTAANYDYGFNWIFDSDGTIEFEVLLTGVLQVGAVRAGEAAADAHTFAHRVDAALRAVHHQHFFNVRLDLDVDGPGCNGLVELESADLGHVAKGSAAFSLHERPIETEGALAANPTSGRRWRIVNWSVRNKLGEPVGYMLVPGETVPPQSRPDAFIRQRARFLDAPLWVTPFAGGQRYAAGDYVNQSVATGLAQWARAARSVDRQDLVVWHTIGVTHFPRPEEWPIMPVYRAGFTLVPSGFMPGAPITSSSCTRPVPTERRSH